jgi:hypothetical protein
MSTSIFIRAIKPADEYFMKMKKAFEACINANIRPPQEIIDYFDNQNPHEMGVIIDHYSLPEKCREEISKDYEDGYRIDIQSLPNGVRYIEVYSS